MPPPTPSVNGRPRAGRPLPTTRLAEDLRFRHRRGLTHHDGFDPAQRRGGRVDACWAFH